MVTASPIKDEEFPPLFYSKGKKNMITPIPNSTFAGKQSQLVSAKRTTYRLSTKNTKISGSMQLTIPKEARQAYL